MAMDNPAFKWLKKLVSVPFSPSEAELAAAYLEIFQNCYNLSSQATRNVHPQCPRGHGQRVPEQGKYARRDAESMSGEKKARIHHMYF